MTSSSSDDSDTERLPAYSKTVLPSPNVVYFRLGIVQLTSYFKHSAYSTDQGLDKVSGQVIDNLVASTFKENDIR
jgi:hypothetical protein